jgi:alkylhydroperoxidase/carboxymuconolactone decarboxylase family protein YurZ
LPDLPQSTAAPSVSAAEARPAQAAPAQAAPANRDLAGLLAELDPQYLDAYTDYRARVFEGNPLDEKTRELISIAVDVSVTHQYTPGARTHIRRALQIGVTPEEILAVIKMVSLVGVQAVATAGPILLEEMNAMKADQDGSSRVGE